MSFCNASKGKKAHFLIRLRRQGNFRPKIMWSNIFTSSTRNLFQVQHWTATVTRLLVYFLYIDVHKYWLRTVVRKNLNSLVCSKPCLLLKLKILVRIIERIFRFFIFARDLQGEETAELAHHCKFNKMIYDIILLIANCFPWATNLDCLLTLKTQIHACNLF